MIPDVGTPSVGRGVDGVSFLGTHSLAEGDGLRTVSNEEISALQRRRSNEPMKADWLDRMGFANRLWSAVRTDELLARAISGAIEDAGIARTDVDLVLAATTTTSRLTTSMGAMALGHLGMRCAAMEIRAGCASAAYALATAYAHIGLGASCVVVASAETLTKVAPAEGPMPYVAADGAGAAVLATTSESGRGLQASWLSSDGSAAHLAGAPGDLPPNQSDLDTSRYELLMDSRFDKIAAPWWPAGPKAVLEAEGVSAEGLGALVLNQANGPRIHSTAAEVGAEAVLVDMVAETANSGSASMMAALDRAVRRSSTVKPMLVGAVGGGLSAAALMVTP